MDHSLIPISTIQKFPALRSELLTKLKLNSTVFLINGIKWSNNPGNRNKGNGNGAGLAWEIQSHCFADEFGITHIHSYGTDMPHDYSQGNYRTMSSIIIKLE